MSKVSGNKSKLERGILSAPAGKLIGLITTKKGVIYVKKMATKKRNK
jgi:hypothetical protein